MAGGMRTGNGWGSMADRVAQSGPQATPQAAPYSDSGPAASAAPDAGEGTVRADHGPADPETDAGRPGTPETVKHCWVHDAHGRLPALLLGWRRTPDGYPGRVVHPAPEGGAWFVVEEWLPADMLEPAAT